MLLTTIAVLVIAVIIVMVVPRAVLITIIGLRSHAVSAVLPVAKLPITILPVGLLVSVSLLFLPTVRVHAAVPIPIVFLTLLAFFAFEAMIA